MLFSPVDDTTGRLAVEPNFLMVGTLYLVESTIQDNSNFEFSRIVVVSAINEN